jgi:two-component system response regulator RegA
MAPRILLIEPAAELRQDFTDALVKRGLDVKAASTTDEARTMCDEFAPDIVIADYDLGDEPAANLLQELRRRHPGIMVLLTSDAFAKDQTIGPITLHPKPSEPRALLDLLRRRVTADSLWHVRRGRAVAR